MQKLFLDRSRLLLLISSAVGVCVAFLPFLRMKSFLYDMRLDVLTYINFFLDLFGVGKHGGARRFVSFMFDRLGGAGSLYEVVQGLALWFIVLGPLFFFVIHLRNLIRGVKGQPYKGGLLFAILYTFLSWFFLWYGTSDMVIKVNFFNKASYGFWLGWVAVAGAFASRFLPAGPVLADEELVEDEQVEGENEVRQ